MTRGRRYPPAGFMARKNQESREAIADVSAETVAEMPQRGGRHYARAKAASLLLAGVSVTETARRVGVTRETIQRWKSNDKVFAATIKKQDLAKIAGEEAKELLASQRALRDRVRSDVVKLKLMGACVDAVDVILDIMRHSIDDKTRLMAAKEVLDRGGFQKTAQIEVHHTQNPAEEVMLAEAFEVLGVDPELSKFALPAAGGMDEEGSGHPGGGEYEQVFEPSAEEGGDLQAGCEQADGYGGSDGTGSDTENQGSGVL